MRRNRCCQDGAKRKAGSISWRVTTPPVAQADFAKCQGADDERRCLRARVAAAARNDERNKRREHHGALNLCLERAHRCCREHFQ